MEKLLRLGIDGLLAVPLKSPTQTLVKSKRSLVKLRASLVLQFCAAHCPPCLPSASAWEYVTPPGLLQMHSILAPSPPPHPSAILLNVVAPQDRAQLGKVSRKSFKVVKDWQKPEPARAAMRSRAEERMIVLQLVTTVLVYRRFVGRVLVIVCFGRVGERPRKTV